MSDSPHDNGAYVKLADVEDRVNRLRDDCRRRDAERRAGLAEASADYLEGYEDALNDLHDALCGFCHESVKVQTWVPA